MLGSRSSKTYPINAIGVKKIGTETWLKNNYVPFTGEDYQTVYDRIFSIYLEQIKQYSDHDVLYWIAIANLKVPYFLSQSFVRVLRLVKLRDKGYEFILGEDITKIPPVIDSYNPTSLDNMDRVSGVLKQLSFLGSIKNVSRTLKYNISSFFSRPKAFLKNYSAPYYLVGGASHEEVVGFCNQRNILPFEIPSSLFVKKNQKIENYNVHIKIIFEFVNGFLEAVAENYPTISPSIYSFFRKTLEDSFSSSLLFFMQNVRFFEKHPCQGLICNGLGHQVHRLLCAAVRYTGGNVVGFAHGNSYCYGYSPAIIYEMSLVTEYVTISDGHKKILQQAARDFSFGLKTGKVTTVRQDKYRQLFNRLQQSKPVEKVKKVMIVGYPIIDSYFPFYSGGFTYAQLDLELRVASFLKENGCYVIYKPHPGWTVEGVDEIFDGYADEIIMDRFEDVYDQADCIFFGDHASTTFGFSLLTNKPIVFANVEGNYWNPRAFELVRKRCSVIDAKTISGRIHVEMEDVMAAIKTSVRNIDYTILSEFAF